jgi:tetratricopeptide (TPR) repeat protein
MTALRRILWVLFLSTALLHGQDDTGPLKEGKAALDQGDLDKAVSLFTTALKINSKEVQAYIGRGEAYERMGDYDKTYYDKAIADYDKAIAFDPKNEKAYYDRAFAERNQGNWTDDTEKKKALDDYTHAIELDPNNAAAWANRGMTYSELFDNAKALADFTQSITLNPKDEYVLLDRAVTYMNIHQFDKALADFNKSIEIYPDPLTYENRGSCYAAEKDFAHAIADYTEVVRLQPDNGDALKSLAEFLATCPDTKVRNGKKAVEVAMKACQLSNWSDPEAIADLAAAYAEAGDFDDAVKWQQKYHTEKNTQPTHKAATAGDRLPLYQSHQPYHNDGSAWSN